MTLRAFKQAFAAILIASTLWAPVTPAQAATARIKDIVNIEGVRDNQLVGYGLVVGLNIMCTICSSEKPRMWRHMALMAPQEVNAMTFSPGLAKSAAAFKAAMQRALNTSQGSA